MSTPNLKDNWLLLFVYTCFLLSSTHSNAQCAGEDGTLTICNISDPANQSINLFSLLNGTPTAGGTWTDPLQTGALNTTTGILNVWNIYYSGNYSFTYTVPTTSGCSDNTASIAITIGGYSGITSPNRSACSDDSSVNLFQFFVGNPPSPHQNGTWTDNNNTGALSGNIFNATSVELGTYSFTYTMPAIGTCPQTSSTAVITVHRAPKPGDAQDLTLCETDDMSIYSNLDLHTLLAGEDMNGRWSESNSSELSSPFDSFINLENIYNTQGPGTYSFTYTVYPPNPVCSIESETIEITIEELLDLTGATFNVNSDICEDELEDATFTAVLTQGIQNIPDGTYQITIQISGQSSSQNITSDFIGGVFTFGLDPENFPGVGEYTISITNINEINHPQVCDNIVDVSDILTIFPLPDLENAALAINPVCLGEDAEVTLSNANGLDNGNYEIKYNLTGQNSATSQSATIAVSNGSATFTLPSNLIPNAGNTTIIITNITNTATLCTNTALLSGSFIIHRIPNTINFSAIPEDGCENQSVTVTLSGLGNMTDISLTYFLSGANTSGNEVANVNASTGTAQFIIPASMVTSAGTTQLTVISLTDNTTTCLANLNLSNSFVIHNIPAPPQAGDKTFCEADQATVADLQPNGAQYAWYDSPTATNSLANGTPLVAGNYYVAQVNPTTGCQSERTMITVTIHSVQPPTLQQEGERFCGAENPTLQDLSDNVTTSENLVWYDAPTNGNLLPLTELLQEGTTYYGFGASGTVDCQSIEALAVTVTLTDCEDDEEEYGFFVPDGFSPNNDAVNDSFRIPDIEFLYPDFTLEIYNRYGNLMFKGNKNKPDWDGKNSDSNLIDGMAPNGVYFYIINFNKNNKSPKQGRLYLNR